MFTKNYPMQKLQNAVTIFIFCVMGCVLPHTSATAQVPVIKAITTVAHYSISGDEKRSWNISPQIARDTLLVKCYQTKETLVFKTDSDSIRIEIQAGQTKNFYVRLKDSVNALTVVHAVPAWHLLSFSKDEKPNDSIRSWYGFYSNVYRDSLEMLYPASVANQNSDITKIAALLEWTHNQWKHSGNNSPKRADAISILGEAKAGGQFPCFAFSIVLAGKLNAAGYTARVLYLKGGDVETNKQVPGHVVTEVYIPSLRKWAFLDGQFNTMPMLNGTPLNAVELQKAFSENFDGLGFYNQVNYNGTKWTKKEYAQFVYPYLFFFDYYFDSRSGTGTANKISGKSSLMLVPAGVKPPVKFGAFDGLINYCIYTNDAGKFYAAPN
jgi:hypothetical protein